MLFRRVFPFLGNRNKRRQSDEETMKRFMVKYNNFKVLLRSNSELLKIISDIEEKLQGKTVFGKSYITSQTVRVGFHMARMLESFENISGRKYPVLKDVLNKIENSFKEQMEYDALPKSEKYILPYDQITKEAVHSVGGKNANLGEAANRVQLPIPKGFAITTHAFYRFIEANDLSEEIHRKKQQLDVFDPELILTVSEHIQGLFCKGKVPEDLESEIHKAYAELKERVGSDSNKMQIAMRSSAIGEDSELSFAGQYLSVLNVPPEKIMEEYKRILASLFSPQAISYRLHMGITFRDAAMSVACLEMVPSKVSGVMYTRHPFNFMDDSIIINAVRGLGLYAVGGIVTPDFYKLSKDSPPILMESKINPKEVQLVARPEGYVMEEQVEAKDRERGCLSEDQAVMLAAYAKRLEDHFQFPQDIEWAIDKDGRLVILQTRPLRIEGEYRKEVIPNVERLPGYTVLLEEGDIGCPGIGYGPAHHVRSLEDLKTFPEGGVLVATHSSPEYVVVMQKAQAILTDLGSLTGHMASLAREFMVPAILNTRSATKAIKQGVKITVDAYSGRVYLGDVPPLLNMKSTKVSNMKGTPTYEMLRRRADLIIPLNLVNPNSRKFSPEYCKTIHDIMRFLHERTYTELFQLSDLTTDYTRLSVRLKAPLPFDLFVIDLGKGLKESDRPKRSVKVDEIVSVPFAALLKGMLQEDLRSRQPRPVELKGFLSVMSEQFFSPPQVAIERFGDRSYAIISDKYLNFSSRVGYHFGIIDTYCGKTFTNNYINFEFKGGAADNVRRNRRVRLIQKILEDMGFLVEAKGDRVTARLAKHEPEVIAEKLDYLGRLLLYTRQMDMLMNSEEMVNQLASCFLKGDYNIECSLQETSRE